MVKKSGNSNNLGTDSGPNDDGLPSYEDVINETQHSVPPVPNRPSASHGSSTTSSSHHSSHSHHKPTSHRPPPPRPSQTQPPLPQKPQSSKPKIPWVYPNNFQCPKCHNTGYKLKNGKSCRSCWRKFAPRNNVNFSPTTYGATSSYYNPMNSVYQPYSMFGGGGGSGSFTIPVNGTMNNNGAPLVVRPGDPRLGGYVCGECRGTGRTSFLLDEDICTVCNGIGRIIR